MLAYANERVLTKQGELHPYFPLVRVEARADVALFRPAPGAPLGEPSLLHALRCQ